MQGVIKLLENKDEEYVSILNNIIKKFKNLNVLEPESSIFETVTLSTSQKRFSHENKLKEVCYEVSWNTSMVEGYCWLSCREFQQATHRRIRYE